MIFLFFLLFQIFTLSFCFLIFYSSYSCHPFGTVLLLFQVYACFKYFELFYLAFSSVFFLKINRYEFLLTLSLVLFLVPTLRFNDQIFLLTIDPVSIRSIAFISWWKLVIVLCYRCFQVRIFVFV